MVLRLFVTSLICIFSVNGVFAADKGFPGREQFPEVKIISKADLFRRFEDVTIVDARSHYEYDTLRITGAKNIPVAAKSFEKQVSDLRKQSAKDIVFYCNGRTCLKSYIAV
jgi:hypothetical protein